MFQAHFVFFSKGEAIADSVVRKTKEASVLAWHPTKKVLAAGWETGEITIRNEQDNESYEVPRVHRAEVTILHWTHLGTRLLSGDSVISFVLSFIKS